MTQEDIEYTLEKFSGKARLWNMNNDEEKTYISLDIRLPFLKLSLFSADGDWVRDLTINNNWQVRNIDEEKGRKQ